VSPVNDCVVSYHVNPFTCGVARFNRSIADVLGIPLIQVGILSSSVFNLPLISIKASEMNELDLATLSEYLSRPESKFDLFLHTFDDLLEERTIIRGARRVFTGNREIAHRIGTIRSDATSLYAPGAGVRAREPRQDLVLLTFGMAHKIDAFNYERISRLLRADDRTYRLEISSALHEGTSFDEEFFSVAEEISVAFAGNVTFLGFLADEEVSRRLYQSDAMVAFFPNGVRENNTTVFGAMAHGIPVITNLNNFSPDWMVHSETVFDVGQLDAFPSSGDLARVGIAGQMAAVNYNFAQLALRILSGV